MLTVNRNKRNATVKQNMTLNYVLLRVFLSRLMSVADPDLHGAGGEGGGHPDKNLNPRKMKSNSS